MTDAHDWFRAYRNMVHKAKPRNLPPVLFKHWWFLLGCTDDDGKLPGDLVEAKNDMRMSRERLLAILDELVKRRFFDKTEEGWVAHNWPKHQYKSDHSGNRVQTFRERQRNVTVTPPETETETEAETEGSSSSSDPSDHPQKPPPPAAESVVSFLSTAKRNEQVAALIDLAKVNDVTLKGGPAAAIVRDYGHGREVIDAFFAYLANRGVGEVHEYMIGVLRGRASRTATGYRRTGEQAGAQMEMAGEGEAALTWEQYQTILKEQGLQSTRAGDGDDAEQDTPDPVPEREAGGRAVQRAGGDDG